jgi:hypothetical protein
VSKSNKKRPMMVLDLSGIDNRFDRDAVSTRAQNALFPLGFKWPSAACGTPDDNPQNETAAGFSVFNPSAHAAHGLSAHYHPTNLPVAGKDTVKFNHDEVDEFIAAVTSALTHHTSYGGVPVKVSPSGVEVDTVALRRRAAAHGERTRKRLFGTFGQQ